MGCTGPPSSWEGEGVILPLPGCPQPPQLPTLLPHRDEGSPHFLRHPECGPRVRVQEKQRTQCLCVLEAGRLEGGLLITL